MDVEDLASVNSELRFITLELMKLAAQRNSSFDDVLGEFMQNTCTLRASMRTGTISHPKQVLKVRAAGEAVPAKQQRK